MILLSIDRHEVQTHGRVTKSRIAGFELMRSRGTCFAPSLFIPAATFLLPSTPHWQQTRCLVFELYPQVPVNYFIWTAIAMSTADTGGNGTKTGRPRKRAAEACTFCRRRKVRLHALNGTWSAILKTTDQVQCGETCMRELQNAWGNLPL